MDLSVWQLLLDTSDWWSGKEGNSSMVLQDTLFIMLPITRIFQKAWITHAGDFILWACCPIMFHGEWQRKTWNVGWFSLCLVLYELRMRWIWYQHTKHRYKHLSPRILAHCGVLLSCLFWYMYSRSISIIMEFSVVFYEVLGTFLDTVPSIFLNLDLFFFCGSSCVLSCVRAWHSVYLSLSGKDPFNRLWGH
jgi:hypothetical protein